MIKKIIDSKDHKDGKIIDSKDHKDEKIIDSKDHKDEKIIENIRRSGNCPNTVNTDATAAHITASKVFAIYMDTENMLATRWNDDLAGKARRNVTALHIHSSKARKAIKMCASKSPKSRKRVAPVYPVYPVAPVSGLGLG